jgi:hypothetical protein
MRATDRPGGDKHAGIGPIQYLALVFSIGLLLPGPHSSPYAHAGSGARIAHYEPLNSLTVDVRAKPGVFGQLDASAVTTVSFETLGRVIVLDLVRNDRLVAKLRSRLPIGDDQLTIYKGSIRSVPGSWARLSIDDKRVSGVVWDGSELLLIDRLASLEGLQTAPDHTLSASANCGSPGAGRLDCDIGLLAAGGSTTFDFEVHANPDLGLGLADHRIQYIDATLTASLHNTARFPDTQFFFVVWGAFYDLDVGFSETCARAEHSFPYRSGGRVLQKISAGIVRQASRTKHPPVVIDVQIDRRQGLEIACCDDSAEPR